MEKNTYIKRCIKELRTHFNVAKNLHEKGDTKTALSVCNAISHYVDFMWYTEVITFEQRKYLTHIINKVNRQFLNILD